MNDIYDTTLYTDFQDLPEETKRALWDEWQAKFPEEKKLRTTCRFLPLIFAVVTALFILASMITAFASGFGIACVLLLIVAVIALVICIVMNERSQRILYDQSVRYAKWLKDEKRVLAQLKSKRGKQSKDD